MLNCFWKCKWQQECTDRSSVFQVYVLVQNHLIAIVSFYFVGKCLTVYCRCPDGVLNSQLHKLETEMVICWVCMEFCCREFCVHFHFKLSHRSPSLLLMLLFKTHHICCAKNDFGLSRHDPYGQFSVWKQVAFP